MNPFIFSNFAAVKALVVIWSFLVVAFSSIPCCAFEECADEVAVEQENHQGNTCDNCSPFLNCGSCHGFVVFSEIPKSDAFSKVSEAMTFEDQKTPPSEYTSTIWQPPQPV